MIESNDPADFDPEREHPWHEPKLCNRCGRVFLNRWIFLRHRPEGREAIGQGYDHSKPCYSDRQLRNLGMWRVKAGKLDRDGKPIYLWSDDARVSPLDEVPGVSKRGQGRQFKEENRYSARHQHEQRKKRKRGPGK